MRSPAWGILLVPLICVASVLGADEAGTAARDAHRAKMARVAESIRLADVEGGSEIPLVAKPILYYSDPTRETLDSALWIWGERGRPAAVMAVEFYPKAAAGAHWLYEIASVSEERISARHDAGLDWSAETPGLAPRPVPESGVPAGQPARRLSQMKQIVRRLAAHERATVEGRIELRALANPLHRYEDPDARLIDGAIFAFTNGSNPEVLLLLEAHSAPDGPAVWMYSLARMTGEAVSVGLDGEEVWARDGTDVPAVREDYVNGRIPAE